LIKRGVRGKQKFSSRDAVKNRENADKTRKITRNENPKAGKNRNRGGDEQARQPEKGGKRVNYLGIRKMYGGLGTYVRDAKVWDK